MEKNITTLATQPITTSLAAPLGKSAVTDIVTAVKSVPIMKTEDVNFLMANSQHLGLVLEKCFMWRTDFQKRSIINDINHPTLHSKFHQAILEQKVQFEQTMYLAKEFEDKKIEAEELECDLEELDADTTISQKRKDIRARKITLQLQFVQFELTQMRVAMEYRMAEVKGWQEIETELINNMHESGMEDNEIWTRDMDEVEELFFKSMANLQGINKTTDGGEYNNLIIVATYAYNQAKEAGLLNSFMAKANDIIKNSVSFIEEFNKNTEANRSKR